MIVFPTGEQPCFFHHIPPHALPSAPLCQREESGSSLGLDHDDFCRSVNLLCKDASPPSNIE